MLNPFNNLLPHKKAPELLNTEMITTFRTLDTMASLTELFSGNLIETIVDFFNVISEDLSGKVQPNPLISEES